MKQTYLQPILEVIPVETADIVCISGPDNFVDFDNIRGEIYY